MQTKKFRFGPLYLTNTYTTNIFQPGTTTGGVNCTSAPYDKLVVVLYQINILNKTSGAVTFRLFVSTTGDNTGGKELAYDISVAANTIYPMNFSDGLRMDNADFLVGGASASTSLVITGTGEIGVA